jgi:hypothetical protein
MSATTRWVQYDVSAAGSTGTGGGSANGVGNRGYTAATGASNKDLFDIGVGSNQLHVTFNGDNGSITLASGTDLDPRFIARDITEKLHDLGVTKGTEDYQRAICRWENNRFVLYTGDFGSTSVAVTSGTNTAHVELGWATYDDDTGDTGSNTFNGGISVSGTYGGFFDEVYTIVIHNDYNIGNPSAGGSNTYGGTITAGGVYTGAGDITYTIRIDTTNGSTMGGYTGNVPLMSWTSTGNADNSSADVELLYPNYWYQVGTRGLMVKFTDGVFSHNPTDVNYAWQIICDQADDAGGGNSNLPVGQAYYIWGSDRGDDLGTASAELTSSGTYTPLGTRGLSIRFDNGTNNLYAGDEFKVICTPPQPQSYNITNLSFGNVTVSTESAVKTVLFEIMAGAVEISTVKFGLQANGSFAHHNQGNSDTYFRFGTVGPGQTGSSPYPGLEWKADIAASDINDATPPTYLYATKGNLSVVSDADASETIGSSTYMGMVADPIWLNIMLGASEVGANSTINYRIYFDYA